MKKSKWPRRLAVLVPPHLARHPKQIAAYFAKTGLTPEMGYQVQGYWHMTEIPFGYCPDGYLFDEDLRVAHLEEHLEDPMLRNYQRALEKAIVEAMADYDVRGSDCYEQVKAQVLAQFGVAPKTCWAEQWDAIRLRYAQFHPDWILLALEDKALMAQGAA